MLDEGREGRLPGWMVDWMVEGWMNTWSMVGMPVLQTSWSGEASGGCVQERAEKKIFEGRLLHGDAWMDGWMDGSKCTRTGPMSEGGLLAGLLFQMGPGQGTSNRGLTYWYSVGHVGSTPYS